MSHINACTYNCLKTFRTSRDTYGGVMPQINESHHTYGRVMSHINAYTYNCLKAFRTSHDTYEGVMSQMNESRHTYERVMSHINVCAHNCWKAFWMSRVTYECVMSHMNASCHIWMQQDTYEWDISRMNESCHVWMSFVTYKCVTYEHVMSHANESHIWTSHVTYECMHIQAFAGLWKESCPHIIQSCHTYHADTGFQRPSKHRCRNESCHTHTNESCHTSKWVMSQVRMRHVTHSVLRMSHVKHIIDIQALEGLLNISIGAIDIALSLFASSRLPRFDPLLAGV